MLKLVRFFMKHFAPDKATSGLFTQIAYERLLIGKS